MDAAVSPSVEREREERGHGISMSLHLEMQRLRHLFYTYLAFKSLSPISFAFKM